MNVSLLSRCSVGASFGHDEMDHAHKEEGCTHHEEGAGEVKRPLRNLHHAPPTDARRAVENGVTRYGAKHPKSPQAPVVRPPDHSDGGHGEEDAQAGEDGNINRVAPGGVVKL